MCLNKLVIQMTAWKVYAFKCIVLGFSFSTTEKNYKHTGKVNKSVKKKFKIKLLQHWQYQIIKIICVRNRETAMR